MSVPHFAFPLSLAGSQFATHEQDTNAEVTDCVEVLLGTPVRSRIALPAYGAPETLYQQVPVAVGGILAALQRWEPRASVVFSEVIDTSDSKILHMITTIEGGTP